MGSSPRGHPAPDHRPGERRQREGSQQGRDALLEYQGTAAVLFFKKKRYPLPIIIKRVSGRIC